MQEIKEVSELKRKILVTCASGYIGGRLVRKLLRGEIPIRVMVRDPQKIADRPWLKEVEVSVANAKDYESTKAALTGIHTAYYLLHSLSAGPDFAKLEAINARNFARAAQDAGIAQIIFLGGIANDKKISKHMASRINTGRLLDEGNVPVLRIRAGIIIGSGSASFEMLRHLINQLPFMTTPKWVSNRTQPIAISDVLYYLSQAGSLARPVSGIFDIGGPDILTYSELFKTFAKLSGLPKRWIIRLPFPSPRFASYLIGLFTPLPTALARPLVGSLISEVIADPKKSLEGIIDPPPDGLLNLHTALELALSKISASDVELSWTDQNLKPASWAAAPSDPDWAGPNQ